MKITFNLSRILAISFLLLCLSGPSFALISSSLPPKNTKKSPKKAISLSIQLDKRAIQASSLEDQIFPMMISSKINKFDLSSFPRNPVDLVFVFEIENYPGACRENRIHQIKEIQDSLKELRPLMTDQDRLAIVVFRRIGYPDNLMDVGEVLPSLTT